MGLRLSIVLILSVMFSAPAVAAPGPRWPCPEFGECRAQVVFGPCQMVAYFEFSRRLQQRGGAALWEPDEPKPCAVSVRVGKNLERFTFELYRCKELEQMLEELQGKEIATSVHDAEVAQCEPTRDAGRATLLHPDGSFFHGEWKSLVREAVQIPGAEDCRVKTDERILHCPQLQNAQRLWVQDFLVAARWRVTGALQSQVPQQSLFQLAPGDRMRSQ